MVALHWIFFVVSVIAFLVSLYACILTFDDEDEERAFVGTTFAIISNGLLIYSSFNIFNSSTAHLWMWSSLAVLLLIEIIVFFKFIKKSYIELFYKIFYAASFLLTVIVCIILKFNSSHSFCLFLSNDTQLDLLWISLFAVSIVCAICLAWLISLILRIKNDAEKTSRYLFRNLKEQNSFYRDSMSDYVSIENIEKLYELYKILKNRSFPHDESYIRDMVTFYLNDLKLPMSVKNRILELFSDSIHSHHDFTQREFQDFILHLTHYANTEISLDNRYLLEEIVSRTKMVLQDELRIVLKQITSAGNDSINYELHEIKEELISIRSQDHSSKHSNKDNLCEQYIRELFHSLMTPISQIEISTDIVKERIDKSDKKTIESLDAIGKGVKLLYAFLFAYRQVVFAGYTSNSENQLTINEGIDSAIIVYETNLSKKVSLLKSNVPNEITGLSNNFVLAILLPLLENSVYATNEGQEITIDYKNEDNNHIFSIQNPVNKPIIVEDLYKDGYSSKTDNGVPHIGIGLSAVRTLIEKKMGSSLRFNLIENKTKLETILTIHLS